MLPSSWGMGEKIRLSKFREFSFERTSCWSGSSLTLFIVRLQSRGVGEKVRLLGVSKSSELLVFWSACLEHLSQVNSFPTAHNDFELEQNRCGYLQGSQ